MEEEDEETHGLLWGRVREAQDSVLLSPSRSACAARGMALSCDYLVVGAGAMGLAFADELRGSGRSVIIVDRREVLLPALKKEEKKELHPSRSGHPSETLSEAGLRRPLGRRLRLRDPAPARGILRRELPPPRARGPAEQPLLEGPPPEALLLKCIPCALVSIEFAE